MQFTSYFFFFRILSNLIPYLVFILYSFTKKIHILHLAGYKVLTSCPYIVVIQFRLAA